MFKTKTSNFFSFVDKKNIKDIIITKTTFITMLSLKKYILNLFFDLNIKQGITIQEVNIDRSKENNGSLKINENNKFEHPISI